MDSEIPLARYVSDDQVHAYYAGTHHAGCRGVNIVQIQVESRGSLPAPLTQVINHPLVSLSSTIVKSCDDNKGCSSQLKEIGKCRAGRGAKTRRLARRMRLCEVGKRRGMIVVKTYCFLSSLLIMMMLGTHHCSLPIKVLTFFAATSLIRTSVIGQRVVTQNPKRASPDDL